MTFLARSCRCRTQSTRPLPADILRLLKFVPVAHMRIGKRAHCLTQSPLTLLPRKRVHSLSVELLNAFVCICPGSRDLGENRIRLKRIPARGLTLRQEPKDAGIGRRSAKQLRVSSSHRGPEERLLRAFQTWPPRILLRSRARGEPAASVPEWRRANGFIEEEGNGGLG